MVISGNRRHRIWTESKSDLVSACVKCSFYPTPRHHCQFGGLEFSFCSFYYLRAVCNKIWKKRYRLNFLILLYTTHFLEASVTLLMHAKTGVAYLSKAAKSNRHKNKRLNKPENIKLLIITNEFSYEHLISRQFNQMMVGASWRH